MIARNLKPDEKVVAENGEFRISCCDCGLVHHVIYKILDGGKVEFQFFRANILTAELRNIRQFKCK